MLSNRLRSFAFKQSHIKKSLISTRYFASNPTNRSIELPRAPIEKIPVGIPVTNHVIELKDGASKSDVLSALQDCKYKIETRYSELEWFPPNTIYGEFDADALDILQKNPLVKIIMEDGPMYCLCV